VNELEKLRQQAHRELHDRLLPAVKKLLPKTSPLKILDAGCGRGFATSRLAEWGHEVIGIDQAEKRLALAEQAFGPVRFEVASVYDDLTHLAPPEGWDVVVSLDVIEHLFAPQKFLANMQRHLSEGGLIILSTPYHGYLKNLAISLLHGWDKHFAVDNEGGHIKFFSRHTLDALLKKSGFSPVTFLQRGRLPGFWKSLLVKAVKLS
jgi:2-polyprenyl-3-methyl-5-hydroxy-6-metoxy-1,4-benzoquinol methylase